MFIIIRKVKKTLIKICIMKNENYCTSVHYSLKKIKQRLKFIIVNIASKSKETMDHNVQELYYNRNVREISSKSPSTLCLGRDRSIQTRTS